MALISVTCGLITVNTRVISQLLLYISQAENWNTDFAMCWCVDVDRQQNVRHATNLQFCSSCGASPSQRMDDLRCVSHGFMLISFAYARGAFRTKFGWRISPNHPNPLLSGSVLCTSIYKKWLGRVSARFSLFVLNTMLSEQERFEASENSFDLEEITDHRR